jgi:transposase
MDKVILNEKEQKRLMVLNEVLAGRLTGAAAAELLGLSLRQTRRLLAGYRREGAAGLAHGNRGRTPVNKVSSEVAAAVVALARDEYVDYNDRHLTEELAERHAIVLSSPTVRRLRRAAGLGSPRKRRSSRHRRRRERYPQAGMLLQVDGSRHDWLEGRGPWLTLHAAIDDATSEVVWAVFREEEDATGYALLLHHLSQTHGLPLALYADRHTIFQNPKQATLAEQLAGQEPPHLCGPPVGRVGYRPYPGLFAAGQRPGRTPLPDPPGPPGQGPTPRRCHRCGAGECPLVRLFDTLQPALQPAAGCAWLGLSSGPLPGRGQRPHPLHLLAYRGQ